MVVFLTAAGNDRPARSGARLSPLTILPRNSPRRRTSLRRSLASRRSCRRRPCALFRNLLSTRRHPAPGRGRKNTAVFTAVGRRPRSSVRATGAPLSVLKLKAGPLVGTGFQRVELALGAFLGLFELLGLRRLFRLAGSTGVALRHLSHLFFAMPNKIFCTETYSII